MEDLINKLKNGENFIVPESDYGKAEIWRINNVYVSFEIPLFGGAPLFHAVYRLDEVEKMLKDINNLT